MLLQHIQSVRTVYFLKDMVGLTTALHITAKLVLNTKLKII